MVEAAPFLLAGAYEALFQPKPGSADLLVIFAHADRHPMTRHEYDQNVLFVKERRGRYYLPNAEAACAALLAFGDRMGAARVVHMGISKAGFGALLWAGICATKRPDATFRALAFSPQTRLWPENPLLYFPSYPRLLAEARTTPALQAALVAHGDLGFLGGLPNVRATIVHGAGNSVDAAEASAVRGKWIRHLALPFSFHGTAMPFLVNRRSEAAVTRQVARLYTATARERDLAATLPADPAEMVKALMAAEGIPSLRRLVFRRFEG